MNQFIAQKESAQKILKAIMTLQEDPSIFEEIAPQKYQISFSRQDVFTFTVIESDLIIEVTHICTNKDSDAYYYDIEGQLGRGFFFTIINDNKELQRYSVKRYFSQENDTAEPTPIHLEKVARVTYV